MTDHLMSAVGEKARQMALVMEESVEGIVGVT